MARIIRRTSSPQQAEGHLNKEPPPLWVKKFGIVFLIVWAALFIIQMLRLDVWLRLNGGEMTGRAAITSINVTIGSKATSPRHWVEGVEFKPAAGSIVNFEQSQFMGDIFERIKNAVEARGSRPAASYGRDWRSRFPGTHAVFPGAGDEGSRNIACRIHYAGLFRRVVYQFEELSPDTVP